MENDQNEQDMASIMGFSNFSEVPKPKRRKVDEVGENDQTINTSLDDNSMSAQNSQTTKFMPIRKPDFQSSNYTHQNQVGDSRQQSQHYSNNSNFRSQGQGRGRGRGGQHGNSKDNRPYYPSEETDGPHPVLSKALEELDQRDLFLLRGGVRDEQGRIVIFNKDMLDDDPWSKIT